VDGHLTGEIRINVEYDKKGGLVEKILREFGASKKEACAIGDGEGDVGMFEAVGLAIGFHSHDSVSRAIHQKICGDSLLDMIRIIREYGD
jgi:phosphoserine phosphatase